MNGAPTAATPGLAAATSRRTALRTIVLACAALALLFRDDLARMATVWMRSDTFGHGVLVAPVAAWLAWRKRDVLRETPLGLSPGALVAMLACAAAWVAADLARVDAAAGFAFVGMNAVLVAALGGPRIARVLAFPLAFLGLMVPFGEFLQPALMRATADVTVGMVRLAGIPVYREGLEFVLPTGRWSVVEACSGLRYLIASVVLGVLYAHLMLRTPSRRAIVVASAFCVPIVANWVRATGIVLLGHASGMSLATGVDHLLYGWVFFGIVMALLYAGWSRLREPPTDDGPATRRDGARAERTPHPAHHDRGARAAVALVALGIAVAAQGASAVLASATEPRALGPALEARLPLTTPADRPLGFRTGFRDARERFAGVVPGGTGGPRPIGVEVAYYARQHETAEMVGDGHSIVPVGDGWRESDARIAAIASGGAGPRVRELELVAPDGTRLLLWHWFTVGTRHAAAPWAAKALAAASLLAGAGDHSVSSAVWTPLGRAPTEPDRVAARGILSPVAAAIADAVVASAQ